ncbi:MAG TPA: hypothetical protein VMS40_19365 [Vicinamibacterales bacterium]|nr:hypothetical protein [Vicinamibacterales bacterium]
MRTEQPASILCARSCALKHRVDVGFAFDMNSDRIDFISSYCDRWCERCGYTSRCSAYACEIAIGMCCDVHDGLELAIGRPCPEDGEADESADSSDFEVPDDVEMSPEQLAEFDRQEAAREARVEASLAAGMARAHTIMASRWLDERFEPVRGAADSVLVEALDVVMHDALFIEVKIRRALDGKDRHVTDRDDDEDPVQNDWNGSAKVALISLQRSEIAWRVIGQASSDRCAFDLAAAARDLGRVVQDEFPHAMAFVRPGFDEPWR